MNFVKALNEIDSRIWGIVLVLIGLASLGLAMVCGLSDVRAAILPAAATMIGGGIGLIQGKSQPPPPPTAPLGAGQSTTTTTSTVLPAATAKETL